MVFLLIFGGELILLAGCSGRSLERQVRQAPNIFPAIFYNPFANRILTPTSVFPVVHDDPLRGTSTEGVRKDNKLILLSNTRQSAPDDSTVNQSRSDGRKELEGQHLFSQLRKTSGSSKNNDQFTVGQVNQIKAGGVPIIQGQQTSFGPIQSDGTYDPKNANYGPFGQTQFGDATQAFGIGQTGGVNVLGSGFSNMSTVKAGWPYGAQVNNGWDINAVGNRWVTNRTTFNWKPQSVAVHDFGTLNGIRAFNTGYENGTSGQAGVNGYTLQEGFVVPVLGQNTVQQANVSGFDLSKFTFNSGTKGTYGPVDVTTNQVGFSAPFLGNLIQRSVWNDQFKKATGQEIPGGVGNSFIPNIPFVG